MNAVTKFKRRAKKEHSAKLFLALESTDGRKKFFYFARKNFALQEKILQCYHSTRKNLLQFGELKIGYTIFPASVKSESYEALSFMTLVKFG